MRNKNIQLFFKNFFKFIFLLRGNKSKRINKNKNVCEKYKYIYMFKNLHYFFQNDIFIKRYLNKITEKKINIEFFIEFNIEFFFHLNLI